ncbi:Crp/Fnr family transcriptional regulator [Methylobacterium nodulans]|uniref:Putative transcriptional regulator, Crp/Fnr family n=1 Tax=Methylobacterium nodulans (strain LMG 21967 / CNCM I-2342 / ORS 2060) TaxID=460265 RepID=B8IV97_METNO|nr:Crp/Fnr family transcriptional regulator [Methylobacterium nodulans]ACL60948.1 putative transcriptional regulator, Crp/Fnr family [Methylobacterium nodulans ORS 2060]
MALLQSAARNRLLRRLSPETYAQLQPHLQLITTELRQVLVAPNVPIQRLYFPESGFSSMTTGGPRGQSEIGLVGPEGLVGATPVLLGSDRGPYEHMIQSPGAMLAIEAPILLRATDANAALRRLLLRSVQVQMVQTAQTAFVNATYQVEARLARWLLMCHDRTEGDELALTHEFLSLMLGVQRTSVTLALQALEGRQLIRARRGRITILNRPALLGVAGDSYGVPEAEHARLIEEA